MLVTLGARPCRCARRATSVSANRAQEYTRDARRRVGGGMLGSAALHSSGSHHMPCLLPPSAAVAAAVATAAAWACAAFIFAWSRSKPSKPHAAPCHPAALPPLALLPTATFSDGNCIRCFFAPSRSFALTTSHPECFSTGTPLSRCRRYGDSFASTVSTRCRACTARNAGGNSLGSFWLYIHICAAAGGTLGSVYSIDPDSTSTCVYARGC
jgi:hypothetical protein